MLRTLLLGLVASSGLAPGEDKGGVVVSTRLLSEYDRKVLVEDGRFHFVGLRAMKPYGGPVPLSTGGNNYQHPGLKGVAYPAILSSDLMSGVEFERERRFSISPLNLAMLADIGVPVKAGPGKN